MKAKEIYARHLSEMIQCRTVSSSDDSHIPGILIFHDLLVKLYPLTHKNLSRKVIGGASLLYCWKGTSGKPSDSIVLMGHMDTVGVNASDWTHKPFSGEIEKGPRGLSGGRIWGRGTIDCKANVCAILEAVERLLSEGFVPKTDLYLSFGHNEEVYGGGAPLIVKHLESLGVHPALVLDEGGAVVSGVLPGLRKPCAMIGVTEKGVANFRFTARSTGGHASTPPKRTPIGRLALFAAGIEKKYPFPTAIPLPVREFFMKVGPEMEGPLRLVFSHPVFFGPLLKTVLPKMGGEARALVTSTCAFTMMNGSDKPNVLPEKAEMTANVRISPDDTLDSIREALENRAKPYGIDVECLMGQEPSPVSATSTPAYELIVRQIKAVYPNAKTAPYVMLASTDARHFTKISSQVFRFSPFIISTSQMAGIHGADENIYVDSLAQGVQFYHDLVYNTLPGT